MLKEIIQSAMNCPISYFISRSNKNNISTLYVYHRFAATIYLKIKMKKRKKNYIVNPIKTVLLYLTSSAAVCCHYLVATLHLTPGAFVVFVFLL